MRESKGKGQGLGRKGGIAGGRVGEMRGERESVGEESGEGTMTLVLPGEIQRSGHGYLHHSITRH